MRSPDVELLWWEGCPSTERALSDLREAMRAAGLDPATVRVREIQSDADAVAVAFVGSPTILIDGTDVQPPGEEPAALTCRVYHRRDGRISPTPDPEDVRDALMRAATLPEEASA
jgi:hypothetical protein